MTKKTLKSRLEILVSQESYNALEAKRRMDVYGWSTGYGSIYRKDESNYKHHCKMIDALEEAIRLLCIKNKR